MSRLYKIILPFIALKLTIAMGCTNTLSESAAKMQVQAENHGLSEDELDRIDKRMIDGRLNPKP